VVVASTEQSARYEAALLAVETTVPVSDRAVLGVGPTATVALGRALCRWAADRLPDGWSAAPGDGADGPGSDDDPHGGVRYQRHPSGLWRALVDDGGRWRLGLCWREVTLPPLMAPHVVGVAVAPRPPAGT